MVQSQRWCHAFGICACGAVRAGTRREHERDASLCRDAPWRCAPLRPTPRHRRSAAECPLRLFRAPRSAPRHRRPPRRPRSCSGGTRAFITSATPRCVAKARYARRWKHLPSKRQALSRFRSSRSQNGGGSAPCTALLVLEALHDTPQHASHVRLAAARAGARQAGRAQAWAISCGRETHLAHTPRWLSCAHASQQSANFLSEPGRARDSASAQKHDSAAVPRDGGPGHRGRRAVTQRRSAARACTPPVTTHLCGSRAFAGHFCGAQRASACLRAEDEGFSAPRLEQRGRDHHQRVSQRGVAGRSDHCNGLRSAKVYHFLTPPRGGARFVFIVCGSHAAAAKPPPAFACDHSPRATATRERMYSSAAFARLC